MNNQSIFQLINSIKSGFFFYPGSKKALINYIHVTDVVNALMLCGSRKESLGNHYNISQVIESEGMVKSLLIGLKLKRKFIKIPEFLTRAVVKILCLIPAFPLTESRLNTLTGDCVYSSSKISAELGFEFNSTLEEEFKLIAKKHHIALIVTVPFAARVFLKKSY
jgi:nucleoside-diphosphate-sugar epimerase